MVADELRWTRHVFGKWKGAAGHGQFLVTPTGRRGKMMRVDDEAEV